MSPCPRTSNAQPSRFRVPPLPPRRSLWQVWLRRGSPSWARSKHRGRRRKRNACFHDLRQQHVELFSAPVGASIRSCKRLVIRHQDRGWSSHLMWPSSTRARPASTSGSKRGSSACRRQRDDETVADHAYIRNKVGKSRSSKRERKKGGSPRTPRTIRTTLWPAFCDRGPLVSPHHPANRSSP